MINNNIMVKEFSCESDLSQFVDSMLFDKMVIASGTFSDGVTDINIDLEVCGSVSVEYNGELYDNPLDFPQELRDAIKTTRLFDIEGLEVFNNNWFEYIIDNTDGVIEEGELNIMTVDDVKNQMIEIAKDYLSRGC